jgi:sec-independent protein translocase protein TatA
MFGLGTQEVLVVMVIAFVLFGGSKLPELARSLGKSLNEFKKGIHEGQSDDGKHDSPEKH